MSASIRPLAKTRARNPELEALASEIRVMTLAVMRANGWTLTRVAIELGISKTQLTAARAGDCDPRSTFLRRLERFYARATRKGREASNG